MRVCFFVLALAFLTASVSAHAACYSLNEAEAEQGIRIHSELMVIGLNCTHIKADNGQSLYSVYREFTSDHGDLFAAYEKILFNYYQRNGQSPSDKINKLRTDFANRISSDAATMRPDLFCNRYAPRISKVTTMDRRKLREWARTFFPSHPVSAPLCDPSILEQNTVSQ